MATAVFGGEAAKYPASQTQVQRGGQQDGYGHHWSQLRGLRGAENVIQGEDALPARRCKLPGAEPGWQESPPCRNSPAAAVPAGCRETQAALAPYPHNLES